MFVCEGEGEGEGVSVKGTIWQCLRCVCVWER